MLVAGTRAGSYLVAPGHVWVYRKRKKSEVPQPGFWQIRVGGGTDL